VISGAAAAAAGITGLVLILYGRTCSILPEFHISRLILLVISSALLSGFAAGVWGWKWYALKLNPTERRETKPAKTRPEASRSPQQDNSTGKLSHELLNFLNNIDMVAYGLRHERLTPRGKKILEVLGRESGRMKRFMQQFRLYVRKAEPDLQLYPLDKLLDDAAGRFRAPADASGTPVRIVWPDGIPPVRIDPVLMGQAFDQLIKNGMDAVEGAGVVTISGKVEEKHLCISVSDTGPGISPDFRDHLFEPFSTSHGTAGTGLGLVIARAIIEAHEGTIDWTDSPGSGATFMIRLPI